MATTILRAVGFFGHVANVMRIPAEQERPGFLKGRRVSYSRPLSFFLLYEGSRHGALHCFVRWGCCISGMNFWRGEFPFLFLPLPLPYSSLHEARDGGNAKETPDAQPGVPVVVSAPDDVAAFMKPPLCALFFPHLERERGATSC